MALYQRGRIWYADYYAGAKRIQESTGTPNRREAEKFLALRSSEIQRGVYVKPTPIPLADFGERYLKHAKLHKRSWRRDQQMFRHLRDFFGEVNLGSITPLRVEAYQQHRVRSVSPSTVNRELAMLKHMFNLAERWQLHQGANPVRLVPFLREDNLKFRTLSEAEERKLLSCSPPYLREMILFAINTGLRSGEIFRLSWEEIDLELKRIKPIVRKTRRPLAVPLNETAYEVLVGRYAVRHGPYAFYNPSTGDRFKDCKLGLKGSLRRAGLTGITWHTFRHTFATRLTRSGVDLVTVKELLGHSTVAVTMRYAHSNDETKRAAVSRLPTSDKVVTIVTRRRRSAERT